MSDLSAPAVLSAVISLRQEEAQRFTASGVDLIVGQTVTDLGLTRSMISTTIPREWERVASVLLALLERQPFRDGPRYAGERIILGALATELRAYAAAAGEPAGETDLRAPELAVRELKARERLPHAV